MNHRLLRGALFAMVLTLLVDSCGEQVSGSLGCPTLCADQSAQLRDTILPVSVSLDSTLVGFPVLGDSKDITLLNRGDTADIRFIVRYDSLPYHFTTSAGADSAISRVDSATLSFLIDTNSVKVNPPVTINAYSVDTTGVDTLVATTIPLFRANRLLGTYTITTDNFKSDTIHLPLDNAKILKIVRDTTHLRIGLQITGPGSVRMRVLANTYTPRLRFRVSADTTIKPDTVLPLSATPTNDDALRSALTVYPVTARGALPMPASGLLAVGGIAGARTYLRFNVPQDVVDSVQVVRATLYLTQAPSRTTARTSDSVYVFSQPVLSAPALGDIRTVMSFLGSPYLYGVDSIRVSPRDSGLKAIELVNLFRYWKSVGSANSSRSIVLRSPLEGGQAGDFEFYSIEAPQRLRPYIHLTYVPRHGFGIP